MEKHAGSTVWRVGSFHVNNNKAKQWDCAILALERMFEESFDLKLDFVAGGANGAGLESCTDDYIQAALENVLGKLDPAIRPAFVLPRTASMALPCNGTLAGLGRRCGRLVVTLRRMSCSFVPGTATVALP